MRHANATLVSAVSTNSYVQSLSTKMGILNLFTTVVLLFLSATISDTNSQVELGPLFEPHTAIFQGFTGSGAQSGTDDLLFVDKPPNSTVTFSKNVDRLVLVCISAKQPVTWEYFINGINYTPLLEQSWSRTIQQPELMADGDSGYLFKAKATLRGLLESQSGLYTCKHTSVDEQSRNYNNSESGGGLALEKLPNFFDIRIPGDHVFLDEQREIRIHPTDSTIDIWCQTSNPNYAVTLWKADAHSQNLILDPILVNNPLLNHYDKLEYQDLVQYQIKFGLFSLKNSNESFGRYICTARDKNYTVNVRPWDPNEDESMRQKRADKYPSPNYMRILRQKRRHCNCTHEPDISDLYDISKKAELASRFNCQFWEDVTKQDWKLDEFYGNGEENCLLPTDEDPKADWAISRKAQSPRSTKKEGRWRWSDLTVLCNEHPDFTDLTIAFRGFDDQLARGFRIGIQTLSRGGSLLPLQYLNQTPFVHPDTNTLDEPGKPVEEWSSNLGLMKYKWRMPHLNLTRIHRVHLFLPYKYSADWKSFVASFVNDLPNSRFIYTYTSSILYGNSISCGATNMIVEWSLIISLLLWTLV